jgi:hypothetical protein
VSYDQYKQLLQRMTAEELAKEVEKNQRNRDQATTKLSRHAWGTMLQSAKDQQRRNADR